MKTIDKLLKEEVGIYDETAFENYINKGDKSEDLTVTITLAEYRALIADHEKLKFMLMGCLRVNEDLRNKVKAYIDGLINDRYTLTSYEIKKEANSMFDFIDFKEE